MFDPIGADTFARSVQALAQEGMLVTPGAVGNAMVSDHPFSLGRLGWTESMPGPLREAGMGTTDAEIRAAIEALTDGSRLSLQSREHRMPRAQQPGAVAHHGGRSA